MEHAIESERQRVRSYLNPETELKLLQVVDEELLRVEELLEKQESGGKFMLVRWLELHFFSFLMSLIIIFRPKT